MKMRSSNYFTILAVAVGLLLMPLVSRAALNAEQLVPSCTSELASEERFCKIYIQGFVDGALTTDPKVAQRVVDEAKNADGKGLSDFMTRALKTRVNQQLERFGASYFADFCLPEVDPEVTILQSIKQEADLSTADLGLARDWVYSFLKTQFPC